MVYPKVESISSLASYAKNIYLFSDSYLAAANTSYRTYSVALSGQHGDAVQAFVDKLNTIQAKVFDHYPTALATYAQTVATYEEALTGHGFNERMWSDKPESDNLNTLYTGDQATEISNKVTEMNNLLKSAAEAAEVEAPDLSSIETTATDGFKTAGTDRVTLASEIDSEWKTFTETLTNNAEKIKSFQSVINNATYLSQLSSTDIVNKIVNGQLSAEHMYYLDGLQNAQDVEAAKILLSELDGTYLTESDFFIALGNMGYVDKLSDEMLDAIYGRVFEEMNQLDVYGRSESLGYFFQSMTTNLQSEKAVLYSERLSKASTRSAVFLKSQALALVPDFPGEGASPEEYEAYYNRMKEISPSIAAFDKILGKAAVLNSIFEYIYGNELGYKNETTAPVGQHEDGIIRFNTKFIKADSLRFNMDASNKSVTFDVGEGNIRKFDPKSNYKRLDRTEYENYRDPWNEKSTLKISYDNVEITDKHTGGEITTDKAAARINELHKKQSEAEGNLIRDNIYTYIDSFDHVSTIAGTTKAIMEGDPTGALSKATSDIPVVKTITEIIDNCAKYSENTNALNSEIKTVKNEYQSNLFDVGGTSIKVNGESTTSTNNMTYDLGANLMKYDLEQNGLRAYAYRDARGSGVDSTNATKAVENFDKMFKLLDEKGENLISGHRNITINDAGGDKKMTSQEVYNSLQNLASNSSSFDYGDWFHTTSNYFDELTGHKTTF